MKLRYSLGVLMFVHHLSATQITIDLGPPRFVTASLVINFNDLNGTPFNGQTLSLDILFPNNEGVLLLATTSPSFNFAIGADTNGTGSITGPISSGYFLNANGEKITPVETSGGGTYMSSYPGELLNIGIAGISPGSYLGVQFPFAFYGAHFDVTMPTYPGVEITGAQLFLYTSSGNNGDQFVILPIPDSGTSALLLALGIIAFGALRTKIVASGEHPT